MQEISHVELLSAEPEISIRFDLLWLETQIVLIDQRFGYLQAHQSAPAVKKRGKKKKKHLMHSALLCSLMELKELS